MESSEKFRNRSNTEIKGALTTSGQIPKTLTGNVFQLSSDSDNRLTNFQIRIIEVSPVWRSYLTEKRLFHL